MDIWERIKAEIRKQNTTQEWVAQHSKINVRTFQGWFTKRTVPKVDDAVAIASTLGVTVEYLVTGQSSGDPWIIENAGFIRDCKDMEYSHFSAMVEQAHIIAECDRSKKIRITGRCGNIIQVRFGEGSVRWN